MHFTMRIHGLESAEQARNFQLDNKELEKNKCVARPESLASRLQIKEKQINIFYIPSQYLYIYILLATLW